MKLNKKSFVISSVIFALLAVLAFTTLFGNFAVINTASSAEIKEVSQNIKVDAYDSEGRLNNTGVSDPNILFDGSPYTQYFWESVNYFKVSPNLGTSENGKYEYYYEIEYQQVRPSTSIPFERTNLIRYAFKNEVTNTDKILPFTFFIDPKLDTAIYDQLVENEYKNVQRDWGDWGTYRFTLFVNGSPKYSMFYFLEPNKITEAPVITSKASSSLSSMNNAYTFTIENYKFVDNNLVKWYVFGESNDGKLYSLTKDDANSTSTDYKQYIWDKYDREGSEFYFDSNGIAGQWEVYCIVYDQNDPSAELYSTRNDTIQVITGKKMSTSFIIWILVGSGVVLLGVVIFIIIKTTKKEKVW